MSTPVTFADVLLQPDYDTVKLDLLTELTTPPPPIFSWESGAVPSSLIEIQSGAEQDFRLAQSLTVQGGLNSTATNDALTAQSHEVYDNDREPGSNTVGYARLTDTVNAGPYTFLATSLLLQAGATSNLRFTGLYAAATLSPTVKLPRGGSVDVVFVAQDVGVEYSQIGSGTLSFFVSGRVPGVTASNPNDWLTKYSGLQQGVNEETDEALRARNLARWVEGGSSERSYKAMAVAATAGNAAEADRVTRVAVATSGVGFMLFDPGYLRVLIASSLGMVSGTVVTQVQDYIAPALVGGSKIPETAKAEVLTAVSLNVAVTATLKVQSTFNTAAFQAQTLANLQSYFSDIPIGGLVSTERVVEVLLYQAGVGSGVIVDADVVAPVDDVQLPYFRVAVAVPTITFQSV